MSTLIVYGIIAILSAFLFAALLFPITGLTGAFIVFIVSFTLIFILMSVCAIDSGKDDD